MSPPAGLTKFLYLAYFSSPDSDRVLYRMLRRKPARAIVEIGLGSCLRAQRLIAVTKRFARGEPLRYAGIDLFETRPAEAERLSLKAAHRMLRPTGVSLQLIPGDPYSALARAANTLRNTDLLIVSADQDPQSLAQAWFYVPRMLHAHSRVLIERPGTKPGQKIFQQLTRDEIVKLADIVARTRRRAA